MHAVCVVAAIDVEPRVSLMHIALRPGAGGPRRDIVRTETSLTMNLVDRRARDAMELKCMVSALDALVIEFVLAPFIEQHRGT